MLDYEVMGLVFSVQNDLGRFWNEKIYQNELAYRCQKSGFNNVVTEAPLQVSYQDFNKFYYIDVIINDAVIYELKTAQNLTGEHRKQALNYLFLLGIQHGKLINMHPKSVEHQFVSTKLTMEKRYDFFVDDLEWHELDEDSKWLKRLLLSLLDEWGAFLELNLFYEAINHFRGGEENVIKTIKVMNGSRIIGTQKVHLLNSESAFKLSSVTKDIGFFEQQLHQFLCFTSLKAIQWINFKYDRIVFKTIYS